MTTPLPDLETPLSWSARAGARRRKGKGIPAKGEKRARSAKGEEGGGG